MLRGRLPGWGLSLLLHLLLLLPLVWFNSPSAVHTPPPLALELWAGGAAPAVSVAKPAPAVPAAPAEPAPAPTPEPAAPQQTATPLLADADIKLKAARPLHDKPPHAAAVVPPAAKPVAKAEPEARHKPEAKPVATPAPVKSDAKAAPAAAPATARAAPAAVKAAPATVKTPAHAAASDDLLSELDLPPGPGKAKQSQRGSSTGVAGGSSSGVADARALYAQTLRNRVRPYVMLPDGLKGNPEVVLEVDILPSLEVRQIRVKRSSGNKAYDDAVQQAVSDMHRFPALPKGADFADYRRTTMTFRPKE